MIAFRRWRRCFRFSWALLPLVDSITRVSLRHEDLGAFSIGEYGAPRSLEKMMVLGLALDSDLILLAHSRMPLRFIQATGSVFIKFYGLQWVNF